ncbi:MAG: Na+ antiporter [Firmicutes bacterium]|nr:Na+ antiporter [Bacillota bacterium]
MEYLSFFWLMLLASIVAMAGRFIKIPYTIALVLTGLIVGYYNLLPGIYLEPHVLFAAFLPPLLFEAGINIRFRPLQRQWLIVSMFSIVGTLISTLIVGYGMHWVLGFPIMAALLFGAIISPTDPISVVALFKRLGINERLSMIVEAESLFNDGIAVVLFSVIQGVIITGTFSFSQTVFMFVVTVCGGGIIGGLIGAIGSRITKEFDDHLLEIMLTTVVAYGSYLAAESIHVSGVVAVVAASLVVGNYGMQRGMSPASRMAVLSFWEYAAFAVNSMVFLLIGLEMFAIPMAMDGKVVVIAIAVVLLGRATSIYGLSFLLSIVGQYILAKWQHVLVWSGLRGALSMAMVLGIGASVPEKEILIPIVFGVVLFSLLGQGLTIEPLTRKLGLDHKKDELEGYQMLLAENMSLRMALSELDEQVKKGAISQTARNKIAEVIGLQLQKIEGNIDQYHMSDEQIMGDEMRKASRIVYFSQKAALQEAVRNGVLDWNMAAQLISKLQEEQDRQGNHGI